MSKVITSKSQINFSISDIPEMDMATQTLMVRPTHFTVEYVINPHMEGNVGKVNRENAIKEWENVRDAFKSTGVNIHEIEGQKGLPDMVFCANQSLPYVTEDGDKEVIMSIMNSDHRKQEVAFIEKWYADNGYAIHHLPYKSIEGFEGMGDALWHPGKRLLWGGYGFRTSKEAYDFINQQWNVPVIALKLTHPEFYHLDTCMCILNTETVLIYPAAFTKKGLDMIQEVFPTVIEVDEYEAEKLFACNATCPNGKDVIIQRGCTSTNKKLVEAGFNVIEVDTEEFLKSGGSVFCMKMMAW
jgi:N-dimethylarginine dimethylaminohydrolase